MPWANSTSNPYCELDFHTNTELYTATASSNPTDALVSVSTNKVLKSPAGTFSIQLLGHDWYYKLKSQDVVVIKMGRRPALLDTVMVGLIDGVYKSRVVDANGVVKRGTRIEGRDFAKVLIESYIQWFPQFAPDESPTPDQGEAMLKLLPFYTQNSLQIGSPAALIKGVLTKILFQSMNFKLKYYQNGVAVDATLAELLRFRLAYANYIVPFMTTMSEYEGTLWNFMTSVTNSPFCELFLDTRTDFMQVVPDSKSEATSFGSGAFEASFGEDGAKIVLMLRKTPFDTADWQRLTTHHITSDDDIFSEDLGRSDRDNYNVFLANYVGAPQLLGENAIAGLIRPLFNAANISTYGLHYLQAEIQGVYEDSNIRDKVISAGVDLTEKLKRWFENNIEYESGTFGIRGNGKLKIGQRVVHDGTGMVYYIEGVQQDFVNFKTWKTTLTVTRGQPYEGTTMDIPAIPENDITAQNSDTSGSNNSATTTEPTTYEVQAGDSLWSIAVAFYQDGTQFYKIQEANPQITDANAIYPGQVLLIPSM